MAIGALVAGLAIGLLTEPGNPADLPLYTFTAGVLLAIGLYGSTHELEAADVRENLRAVVVAVTLGVLLKAALISAVMVLVVGGPEAIVLGIAVAQIDPLSVAAMGARHRMSRRAKTLLSAWASFDDPMTVLLSFYFAVLALRGGGGSGTVSVAPDQGAGADFLLTTLANVVLFAIALLVWHLVRRLTAGRRTDDSPGAEGAGTRSVAARRADVLALLLVVVLVLVAATYMLVLAVALAGLFVRVGRFKPYVNRTVSGAFLVAAGFLGVLLAQGIDPLPGLALGAAAFGAQMVAALLAGPWLVPGISRVDRYYLGLGQQNGITAILLALALEPQFPGTAGVVGPAILVVNVLHHGANRLLDRKLDVTPPAPPPALPSGQEKPTPHGPETAGPEPYGPETAGGGAARTSPAADGPMGTAPEVI
ncbi:cation:proton antiporter [Streptomyces sp. IB2014 016-6]|uniref:cation:proton antiporter n=1 Tax=Streptomyces sp. IB2014 016-6 TaxID=2517818 RepID=UPI00164FD91D|nr:cation:proton antiporter [Streptomyces sp. IB2014 016-6]